MIFLNAIVVREFGGADRLAYNEIEKPQILENQVMIQVKATSVNFADIKKRKGAYPGKVELPFIPGLEASGVVVAVGKNARNFSVGQKVIALPDNGSYAQYIAVNENVVFPIPESMSFETAAAFPIAGVASYKLLKDVARVETGESVLIHAGAGGFGTTAIQIARLLGAKTIIATVGSEHKKGTCHEVGATNVLNYTEDNWTDQVLDIAKGKGVDIILDSLGGEIFTESMKCLAPFGRIVYYGNATGEKAKINIDELYPSTRQVLGYSFGLYRKEKPNELGSLINEVISFMEKDEINIAVTKKFPLEEAAAAHEWIESRQSTGKVLLIP